MTDAPEKDNSPLLDEPVEEGQDPADNKENVGASTPDADADVEGPETDGPPPLEDQGDPELSAPADDSEVISDDDRVVALEGQANPLVTSPLS